MRALDREAALDSCRPKRSFAAALVLVAIAAPSPGAADADLSMTITAPSKPLLPGQVAGFVVEIANVGPDPSEGVVLTCQQSGAVAITVWDPGGRITCTGPGPVACDVGTLQPLSLVLFGDLVYVDLTADSADVGGEMVLSCTVTATTPDPGPGPNSALAYASVVPSSSAADLTVALSAAPRQPSGLTTISVLVQNLGPSDAPQTTVEAGLVGFTLGSAWYSQPGSHCTSDLDTCVSFACLVAVGEPFRVYCDLGDIAPGEGATASFQTGVEDGTYAAFADASSLAPDPTPRDAHVTSDVAVVSPPQADSSSSSSGCGTAGTSSAPVAVLVAVALALARRRRALTSSAARRGA